MTTQHEQKNDLEEDNVSNLNKSGGKCREGEGDECYRCGQGGHKSRECPQIEGGGDECYRCGQAGHKSRECPQRSEGGGDRKGNGCYICDEDGHKSYRCPQKGKGAGTGKRKRSVTDIAEKESNEQDVGERAPKKIGPNVFVGFQVSNPAIHKAICKVQDGMVSFDEKLKCFLVPVAKSHITLLVARVKEENMEHAIEVVKKGVEKIKTELGEKVVNVTFEGIGSFGNKVIFSNPVGELEEIKFMRDVFLDIFTEENICVTDTRFNAHLTIAKCRGRGKISPESYHSLQDLQFGIQQVRSIQLLSITKRGTEQGYYYSEAEFLLDNLKDENEDQDHTECCIKESLEREQRKAKREKEKALKTKRVKFKDKTVEDKEELKGNKNKLNSYSMCAIIVAGLGIACSYFYFSRNSKLK